MGDGRETLDALEKRLATWHTTGEVARRLGCGLANVYSLIRRERVIATRSRFGWLIDPESVSAYERERATKSRRVA